MQNIYRVMKPRSVGDPSSKYGYDVDGKRFEADMKAHREKAEFLWSEFVSFMKLHKVTPSDFQKLFHRYYDEFLK